SDTVSSGPKRCSPMVRCAPAVTGPRPSARAAGSRWTRVRVAGACAATGAWLNAVAIIWLDGTAPAGAETTTRPIVRSVSGDWRVGIWLMALLPAYTRLTPAGAAVP